MAAPDFERARNYARYRLQRELAPDLYYHNLGHTQDDVVPAAERLAAKDGVNGADLLLLRTAAWFHDVGFVEQRFDNEEIAVRIVTAVLPTFGYDTKSIEIINGMIRATRLPASPQTHCEQIIADADLDLLGREDYLTKNAALRQELAAVGSVSTDQAWYKQQLQFIQDHRYFTLSAKTLNDAGKQRNINLMTQLLAQSSK